MQYRTFNNEYFEHSTNYNLLSSRSYNLTSKGYHKIKFQKWIFKTQKQQFGLNCSYYDAFFKDYCLFKGDQKHHFLFSCHDFMLFICKTFPNIQNCLSCKRKMCESSFSQLTGSVQPQVEWVSESLL